MRDGLPASGRIHTIWDTVRTSFWFVPSIMMIVGVLLSVAGLWLDLLMTDRDPRDLPLWVYVSGADDARDVVSTLLSSMITMTSLVFSITMVVLTLAANQFGPRLVRNFMASPHTQVVLGTFVMTILYCLVILSTIGWRGRDGELPFYTVTAAIGLTAISTALLVLFIHSLARSIVSETVVDRVGRELDELLLALPPLQERQDLSAEDVLPADFGEASRRFGTPRPGYVQTIETEDLVKAASASNALIGLYFRPGDYVAQDGYGIAIYPAERDNTELRRKVASAIALGAHRTPVQDIEYSIRHLVEIAVRALSPGVNDPYTAVAVVDRLSASLSLVMERELPKGIYSDEGGAVRLVCPRASYSSIIGAAFDQIRQNSADKPLLVIHQIEALQRVAEHATLPEQREGVRQQLTKLAEDAEREIASSSDRTTVKDRLREVLKQLDGGSTRSP